MAFGQAFATAFLNGLTGQIQERRKEVREDVKLKKRIAEQAGLPQYLKRQKNYNSYMSIANTLIQDYGADKDLVKVLATDPEKLIGASEYIEKFKQKYDGRNITPARINGFLGSLRMAVPDKELTLKDAVKMSAGLAVDNTDLDAEKANPGIMEDNFLFSVFGLNRDDRVKRKLAEQKVGGDFTYQDLYRMGLEGDPTADNILGAFDYSFLPQEISATEARNIEDGFESQVVSALTIKQQQLSGKSLEGLSETDRLAHAKELNKYTNMLKNYTTDAREKDKAITEFGGGYIANKMLQLGQIEPVIRGVGSVTDAVAASAIKELLDNPRAVKLFGEQELQKILNTYSPASSKGKRTKELDSTANNNKGLGDDADAGKDTNVSQSSTDKARKMLLQSFTPENLEKFVDKIGADNLPPNLPAEYLPPRGSFYNQELYNNWKKTFGKYYTIDGVRKPYVAPTTGVDVSGGIADTDFGVA
tara:strand:- start:2766 stop:4190 length:1425 start_codon:yes stop_codon:yes gene_type:complete